MDTNADVQIIGRNGNAQRDLDNVLRAKPALITDLDGTVRHNPEGTFINEPEDIAFYDGVIEALWRYREEGFLVAAVTNQGGVAHGHLTVQDWERQVNRMVELAEEVDDRGLPFVTIKAAFYMENGTEDRWAFRSLCRKPRYGLLAAIEREAEINNVIVDWDRSYMIGDREEDQQMAEAAGVEFYWAQTWREQIHEQFGGDDDA